ncbi:hypothetical protein [Mycolicibacterium porcinum]
MSVLITAAESIPPEWDRYGQIAGAYFALLGYFATGTSLRSANRTYEAKLRQERQRDQLVERITETTRHLNVVEGALESAAPGEKYDIHQHFSRLRNERAELISKADELEDGLMSSALRSRQMADLMLILTFLGIAGGAALLVMQLFIVAPFVLGVSPGTYVAYRRLNNATKDASGMAHVERMRQVEFDAKKLELEEKKLEIAEKQEVREIEAAERRLELMSKRHELEEKIHRAEQTERNPEH